MQESNKNEYFVDGFMLKHFGVWPSTLNKNNLFEEQKIFLMYLVGLIPSIEDWNINVDYRKQKDEILSITSIKLDKTESDLASFQGKSLDELRKDKLKSEKILKIKELNEKFGVKEDEKESFEIIDSFESSEVEKPAKEKLWDMLEMKGLLKPKTDKE